MNKFNILEKSNMIYIIMLIFVVCASIHLYKINNNNNNSKSSFMDITENQYVLSSYSINIPSTKQVLFKDTGIDRTLYDILDNKAKSSDLSAKADDSVVQSLIKTVESKADQKDLLLKADQKDLVLTNAAVNNAMPELSIIAYAGGDNLPLGWQLCDGSTLLYYNTTTKTSVNKVFTSDENPIFSNLNVLDGRQKTYGTPDLKGRFILGSNPSLIPGTTKNLDISIRLINQIGGEEKHKLSIEEMPKHSHNVVSDQTIDTGGYCAHGPCRPVMWYSDRGGSNQGFNYQVQTAGNNESHENMPPFYVLTYIIKQPIKV